VSVVFAVFREGVYRHECGGVFDTEAAARAAAASLLSNEPDDYHEYVVVPFHLNAVSEHDPGDTCSPWLSCELVEPKPLATYTRKAKRSQTFHKALDAEIAPESEGK
jgi:hypothetical protein